MASPFNFSFGQQITTPQQVERNRLLAAALSNRPAAQNVGQGLAALAGGFTASQLNNRADAAEQAGMDSVASALSGLGPNADFSTISSALSNPWISQSPGGSSIAQALMNQNLQRSDPSYQLDMAYKQAQIDALTNKAGMSAGGVPTDLSLTPQWGIGEDGNYVMLQTSPNGQLYQSDIPEGVQLLAPGDIAEQRAAGTERGKTTAGAEAALPSALATVQAAKDTIASIRANTQGQSEQFGNVLGVPQQMLPVIPGTPRANLLVDIDQINGQAFLQAREFLKGQGQVTDFESRRAESAFSRIQSAIEKGDQKAFEAALTDFETALDNGVAKVAAQAGVEVPKTETPSGEGWTDLGGGIRIRPIGD